MFIAQVEETLQKIEQDESVLTRDEAVRRLRVLGLDDFGLLYFFMPFQQYPKLSSLLPRMASESAQKLWTGNAGVPLLNQTTPFVRSLCYNFSRITGRSLDGAKILDYGCGYGRISRLMYYFADEDRVFGCDPWAESIDVCHSDGLGRNFRQSSYRGSELPFEGMTFDLIFSFSVFTHLSMRTCTDTLKVLRKYIEDDGVLAITIRPVEYWKYAFGAQDGDAVDRYVQEHRNSGFAFYPHQLTPIDGDVSYGDTSMTIDWLRVNAPEWNVVSIDRSLADGLQVYVFLTPNLI